MVGLSEFAVFKENWMSVCNIGRKPLAMFNSLPGSPCLSHADVQAWWLQELVPIFCKVDVFWHCLIELPWVVRSLWPPFRYCCDWKVPISPGKLTFLSFLSSSLSFFPFILFIIFSRQAKKNYLVWKYNTGYRRPAAWQCYQHAPCPYLRSRKSLVEESRASCRRVSNA